MINTRKFNAAQFNAGAIPAADDAAPTLAPTLGVPFRFEVYTRGGTWRANVTQWSGGTRKFTVNEPDMLVIDVAADDASASYLTFPNEIWMWRGQYQTVWQKYKIVNTQQSRSGDGNWIRVEAESLMGDLARETIVEFATPVSEDDYGQPVQDLVPVRSILGDLLSAQTQTPAIRLGAIEAAIGNVEISIRFENRSILSCINDIHRIVGGFFSVDTSRTLSWRRKIGYERGHWVRLEHNMTDIEVSKDYRAIKNRIVAYGAGFSNATRLTVTVNDAASQALYGVLPGTILQPNVNDEDTLEEIANAELARWSGPATSYKIGMVDLSQIDPVNRSFEALALTPGTEVQVICDDPAVDIQSRVRSVQWNLANPAHVEVEFSDPDAGAAAWGGNQGTHKKDLVDRVVDLVARAEELTSDTGVALAVARSMDPPTDNVTDILTLDNAGDLLGGLLEEVYGGDEPTPERADGSDRLTDAMIDRLIDALSNASHPKNEALRAAIGAESATNVWVPYAGS